MFARAVRRFRLPQETRPHVPQGTPASIAATMVHKSLVSPRARAVSEGAGSHGEPENLTGTQPMASACTALPGQPTSFPLSPAAVDRAAAVQQRSTATSTTVSSPHQPQEAGYGPNRIPPTTPPVVRDEEVAPLGCAA